jgi:hypothetical protein
MFGCCLLLLLLLLLARRLLASLPRRAVRRPALVSRAKSPQRRVCLIVWPLHFLSISLFGLSDMHPK